jgi:Histidine kinase-, DNA gyrase B-, and HSP90-like ATPase
VRDEIYNIAAEALRNAFHHAGATRIDVFLRYDHRHFRLVVRDDGVGLDPAVLAAMSAEGHYGLRAMRERAGVIGGRLVAWSEPGEGTEIEVRVPMRTGRGLRASADGIEVDAVFVHAAVELRGSHAQSSRRLRFVPLAVLQDPQDRVALEAAKVRRRITSRLRPRFEGEDAWRR